MNKDLKLSKNYLSAAGWDPDEEIEKLRETHAEDHSTCGSAFVIHEAEATVADQAIASKPHLLFGELWRRGEVTLMFGEPCVGKSILAVQIAEAIALGASPEPFAVTAAEPVLYIDMEFTARQFAERYSFADHYGRVHAYRFPAGFYRAELRDLYGMTEKEGRNVAKYIAGQIRDLLAQQKAAVVIIDNISYLTPGSSSAQAGAQLIKTLKLLAKANDISILATTHLKTRPPTESFRHSQMTEGQRLLDLADSAFMLGNSTMGTDIRYLRQLKSRSGKLIFDTNLVAALQLTRQETSPAAEHEQARLAAQNATSPGIRIDVLPPRHNPLGITKRVGDPVPQFIAASKWNTPPEGSFVGLRHVGFSEESAHTTNYRNQKTTRRPRRINSPRRISSPNPVSSPHVSKGSTKPQLPSSSENSASYQHPVSSPNRVSSPHVSKGSSKQQLPSSSENSTCDQHRVSSPHVSKGSTKPQLTASTPDNSDPELPRTSKRTTLTDILMSPEYHRYLKP